MNLSMIRPKKDTEDLLLLKTKNCEMSIKQINEKAEETLELRKSKPRETFPFNPPVDVWKDWMIWLLDLEVCKSFFTMKEENDNVELYTHPFDSQFSINDLKDKVA